MFKPAVYMMLLVGLVVSAAAVGNGGSLKGKTDGPYSSSVDHGLLVFSHAP
jgi:hypothetical protein